MTHPSTHILKCVVQESRVGGLSRSGLFCCVGSLCRALRSLRSASVFGLRSAKTPLRPTRQKIINVFRCLAAVLLRFLPLPLPKTFASFPCLLRRFLSVFFRPVLVCPLLRRFIQTAYALWSRSRWFAFSRVLSPCFCCCFSFVPFWCFPVLTGLVLVFCFLFSSARAPCSLSSLRPSSRESVPPDPLRVFGALIFLVGLRFSNLAPGGSSRSVKNRKKSRKTRSIKLRAFQKGGFIPKQQKEKTEV